MNLQPLALAELEQLYVEREPAALPAGCFRGRHLCWISPGARHPLWRPLTTVSFVWTPFGVDLDARRWWFWSPRLALGHFDPRPGPSRWRRTRTVGLHYDLSRLPLRGLLYDELKPLSPDLCLGIGGINAETGRGDLFFFALERMG